MTFSLALKVSVHFICAVDAAPRARLFAMAAAIWWCVAKATTTAEARGSATEASFATALRAVEPPLLKPFVHATIAAHRFAREAAPLAFSVAILEEDMFRRLVLVHIEDVRHVDVFKTVVRGRVSVGTVSTG